MSVKIARLLLASVVALLVPAAASSAQSLVPDFSSPDYAAEVARTLSLAETPTSAPVDPQPASGDAGVGIGVPGPGGQRYKTYELPAVNVSGQRPNDLREEDRVGPYGQPRWTATRRFPNTRIYVIPEGKVEAEFWAIPRFTKGGDTNTRYLAEIEYGLPYRFQLDLYYRNDVDNTGHGQNGAQAELRWAFADWGKIPLNPTIYAEYIWHEDGADAMEFKLLLGDELAPRWHYGINLVAELETGGEREYTYEFDAGISYTIIDEKLSFGAEVKVEFTSVKDERSTYEGSVLVGPSVQWRPIPRLSVNVAPLFGCTDDAANARVYINLGYEF